MNRVLLTWLAAGTCIALGSLAAVPALAQNAQPTASTRHVGPAGGAAVAPAKAGTSGPIDLSQPLPTDERLITGVLPNGMSYIVVKNALPAGRANMWMHVSTGSLNETESQRGLAHFLEHMAFKGSEHFAPDSVVDFFQSMGLTFGRDQNAFTSFDQTTYQLALPDTKPETLEKGMRFFADVGGHLTLAQDAIDKERGVILEEKRTRVGAQQRMNDYILERLIPGSLYGKRLPIGVDDALLKVKRSDFQDYYDHWYIPSNMTLLVVADSDPAPIIEQITKSFGGGERRPVPTPQDPGVKPYDTTRAIVASDPEHNTANIEIVRIDKPLPPSTTIGAARADLVRELALSAFDHRIGKKLDKGGTSYLRAGASASNSGTTFFESSVEASGKPEQWRAMLDEVATDLQRARLHGFTAREIDDVKTNLLSGAEEAVARESSVSSARFVQRLNSAISDHEPVMSPAQELDLLKRVLPTITPAECSKVFADLFDSTNVTFIARLPSGVAGDVPSESDLIAAGRKALDVKPEAEQEQARATSLLKDKPKPGAIAEQSEHKETGFTTAWLDNGIVVHHRAMDYEKNAATLSITLAAGGIEETAETRGLAEAAGLAFSRHATSTLSSTDITDLMNGKKARVGGGGGGGGGRGGRGGGAPGGARDTMTLTVSGDPADFEPAMQLAYLLLTDPKIETAAFEQWKTVQKQGIEARKKSAAGVLGTAVAESLYPASEARTQPITAAQVDHVTLEAAQKWLNNAIKTAPIEVSVVGDISREQAMDLVKTYLGSLPKRERISSTTLASLRKLDRPKGPINVERTLDTQTDQAQVVCGFYACDASNVMDRRNLSIASQILSTRVFKLVRADEALAYSPRAALSPGVEYPGFGIFALQTTTKPTKAARLVELANQIFTEFAKTGPTDEEMETVKKQIANTLDTQLKEPGFWLTLSRDLVYRGANLDDALGAPAYYEKLTGDAVRASFAKYYSPSASFSIVARPEKINTESEKIGSATDAGKKDVKSSTN